MSAQPTVPTPAAPTHEGGASVTANPEPAAAAPETPKPTDAPKPNVWEDPDAAKAEIERLRKENGAARTNAKQQAADEARKELAQTIGKALGLVQDEPVDPTELTKQLTSSQEAAKQAQTELAVFRSAGADVDAAALLDSRDFLAKVAQIDSSDQAALTALIQEQVTANPARFGKAAAQPQGLKPNPAQGRSASPPATVAEQIAAAQAVGDARTVARLKAAQAMELST